jgi:guanosine-3',5'-bis(diphosphate) 3'-pyrophosphohydrolase
VLMGAVLHDTVEDTDTTLEEIEGVFGAKVRSIVDEVTDDKSLPSVDRKRCVITYSGYKSSTHRMCR